MFASLWWLRLGGRRVYGVKGCAWSCAWSRCCRGILYSPCIYHRMPGTWCTVLCILPYRTIVTHCRIMLFRTVSCCTVPYCTVPYHVVPYRVICCAVPYRTRLYRTVSYRTLPYHVVPYHAVPYRIISYCPFDDWLVEVDCGSAVAENVCRGGLAV